MKYDVIIVGAGPAGLFAAQRIHKAWHGLTDHLYVTMPYVVLVAVAMQGYWMYTYRSESLTVFRWLLDPLLHAPLNFGAEEKVTYAVQYGSLANILFHLSYLALLFLAIGGILYCLSSRYSKRFCIIKCSE